MICIDKLSLGLKYIAAKLTSETQAETQAFSGTYDGWYQRMRTTMVADIAKELGMSVDQFAICLGLGWSPVLNSAWTKNTLSRLVKLWEECG